MKKNCLVIFVLLIFPSCANDEVSVPAERPTAVDSTADSAEPADDSLPAASGAQPTVIASGDSEISGIRAEIHELTRGAGEILTLHLSFINGSDDELDFGYAFVDPSHSVADFSGIGGIYLVDAVGREKLSVMRDPDNRCICSRKVRTIPAGERAQLWAKFPAPPAEVDRVSIMIPKFLPIDDVPVAAASSADTRESAESRDILATAQGEVPGRRVEIRQLERGAGDIVDLRFTIVNESDQTLSFGYDYADPKHDVTDFGSIGGVSLLDPLNRELYGVVRDSENKCACSQDLRGIGRGERVELWAKFPAPPESADRLSIVIPHFLPVDDVPLEESVIGNR